MPGILAPLRPVRRADRDAGWSIAGEAADLDLEWQTVTGGSIERHHDINLIHSHKLRREPGKSNLRRHAANRHNGSGSVSKRAGRIAAGDSRRDGWTQSGCQDFERVPRRGGT